MLDQKKDPALSRWERALSQWSRGDARFLLELLLVPTTTDGRGNPLTFEQLPDDRELRNRVVRALLARPDWAAGNLSKLWTHVGRGGKPTLSALELGAAKVYLSGLNGDARADALESLAASYGIKPDTLRKKLASKRRAD